MKVLLFLLGICTVLFAQNGSWWVPQFPISGDTVTIYFDPAQSAEMPDNVTSLVLHWGVNESAPGAWVTPPVSIRPPGTVIHTDNVAARSPMVKDGNIWKIRVATDTTINTMHYVINSGTPASPGSYWAHSNGSNANWNITLSRFRVRALLVTPQVSSAFGDPLRSPVFLTPGDTLQVLGIAGLNNTQIDSMYLSLDDIPLVTVYNDTLQYTLIGDLYARGARLFRFTAVDTSGVADTVTTVLVVNAPVTVQPRPEGVRDGIHYNDDTSVTLSLYAPRKDFVYVIGDFNDWRVDSLYFMNKAVINADSVHWWLTISGLTPGLEYGFQYFVDGQIRIGDPYAGKFLDPWNDQYISDQTYPNLKSYPQGKTTEMVSLLQTDQAPFEWVYSDTFTRPPKQDLVIYELLIRDFLHDHDYATLIDTLDYLQGLGINAIELMPVNEFDANLSWGYNPAFYFAPDKYYGPAEDLKRFIDECHSRGIAVILDVVLNHTFGQSPFVRLYNEGGYGRPTPDNPWLNVEARHPFNVGYDFNHESPQTKALVDRVTEFWLTEYKVDGYRFDLSKGFTQKLTTDVGVWGQYDATRIAILKRIADFIWSVDPQAYVILEHFADNTEDKVLADYGMLMWANMNRAYMQSSMGWLEDSRWSSDLSGTYYKTRSFNSPHLLAYMESHDEPWIMHSNLNYGRSSGSYDIKNLEVALNRIKLAAAFFLTIPGPKMIWQFGELGYDQLLPEGDGRTAEKPILWNYFQQENRRKLYKVFAALLKLRRENEVFRSASTTVNLQVGQGQYARRIGLFHASMNVIIIGNFHVIPVSVNPNFPYSGTWYDYFSGAAVPVSDTQELRILQPGEFYIYTDQPLETPEADILNSVSEETATVPAEFTLMQNYPNPFNPVTKIGFDIPQRAEISVEIFDILGRKIRTLLRDERTAGRYEIVWDGRGETGEFVGSGMYIYQISAMAGGQKIYAGSRKMILLR